MANRNAQGDNLENEEEKKIRVPWKSILENPDLSEAEQDELLDELYRILAQPNNDPRLLLRIDAAMLGKNLHLLDFVESVLRRSEPELMDDEAYDEYYLEFAERADQLIDRMYSE